MVASIGPDDGRVEGEGRECCGGVGMQGRAEIVRGGGGGSKSSNAKLTHESYRMQGMGWHEPKF